MGRKRAQGLSCRDVIFRTREIAAFCVGEGRRSDLTSDCGRANWQRPNPAKKPAIIRRRCDGAFHCGACARACAYRTLASRSALVDAVEKGFLRCRPVTLIQD